MKISTKVKVTWETVFIGGQMNTCIHDWTYECMPAGTWQNQERVSEWVSEQRNEWTNEQTDGQTDELINE